MARVLSSARQRGSGAPRAGLHRLVAAPGEGRDPPWPDAARTWIPGPDQLRLYPLLSLGMLAPYRPPLLPGIATLAVALIGLNDSVTTLRRARACPVHTPRSATWPFMCCCRSAGLCCWWRAHPPSSLTSQLACTCWRREARRLWPTRPVAPGICRCLVENGDSSNRGQQCGWSALSPCRLGPWRSWAARAVTTGMQASQVTEHVPLRPRPPEQSRRGRVRASHQAALDGT